MDFLVERPTSSPPVVHLTLSDADSITALADALALAVNAGPDAAIWIHGTTTERRAFLDSSGYQSDRTLLKMSCPLPVPAEAARSISTSAFTDADLDDFVAVNNRAFSWHPEQSGLTAEAVRQTMTEPWFSADGFRLHSVDGALAAFCWTKIHDTDPDIDDAPVGEIYVIAVDPAFHGQGLGKAMTMAGLEHINGLGITTGMLYVESDNTAAVATYEKLGFTICRTDTLWTQP